MRTRGHKSEVSGRNGWGESPREPSHILGASRAFTLLELLAVLAVMMVLAAILAPALSRSKESGRRIQCLSNLRQMILAALQYAEDDKDQSLSPAVEEGDRNLNWLYRDFLPDTRIFLCPSTQN